MMVLQKGIDLELARDSISTNVKMFLDLDDVLVDVGGTLDAQYAGRVWHIVDFCRAHIVVHSYIAVESMLYPITLEVWNTHHDQMWQPSNLLISKNGIEQYHSVTSGRKVDAQLLSTVYVKALYHGLAHTDGRTAEHFKRAMNMFSDRQLNAHLCNCNRTQHLLRHNISDVIDTLTSIYYDELLNAYINRVCDDANWILETDPSLRMLQYMSQYIPDNKLPREVGFLTAPSVINGCIPKKTVKRMLHDGFLVTEPCNSMIVTEMHSVVAAARFVNRDIAGIKERDQLLSMYSALRYTEMRLDFEVVKPMVFRLDAKTMYMKNEYQHHLQPQSVSGFETDCWCILFTEALKAFVNAVCPSSVYAKNPITRVLVLYANRVVVLVCYTAETSVVYSYDLTFYNAISPVVSMGEPLKEI